jgi:hypothetical protein
MYGPYGLPSIQTDTYAFSPLAITLWLMVATWGPYARIGDHETGTTA